MSRETVLTASDGVTKYSFDNIKTQGWLNGHRCGLDAASSYLKELAVQLFKDGKDSEAIAMRKLADSIVTKLGPEMDARAKRHAEEYPMIIAPMRDELD